ncbi:MAG: VOC family protein, partial [Candidatus Eremiobacteraeota bacterium]|nr:VOC family protein [Candidatus Eremiobacteraeota bacterium]
MLDHILLGCNDLEAGIAFVEKQTGVRAEFGGVHPGRGTCNALLSLGDEQYLEIIAPDPEQDRIRPWAANDLPKITDFSMPRLIGWAARCSNLESIVEDLRQAGIAVRGPSTNARRRRDGSVLTWKMATLENDYHGILPFLIEWGPDSIHPSNDASPGCRLKRFTIAAPPVSEIERFFHSLTDRTPVEPAETFKLIATIA